MDAPALLAELTPEEKAWMLSGDAPPVQGFRAMAKRYNATPIVAGAVPRLGIEGIRFSDGPRGCVMGRSTAFPVPMARAATFDPALEERIGAAIGAECRAQGANLFAGVCVNLLRHPAWGRAQETYGEEPHLLGEMGAALVRGAQRHVMACVKHFACNSIENSRFWVDVRIDERTLHDLYLPHFRRVVDEGAAAVMSAYNRVNGEWCGAHRELLTHVLKERWGFDGFVMSDFILGVRGDPARAVEAGLDLEMPFNARLRRAARWVREGRLSPGRVDDAVLRLLRAQERFADRPVPGPGVVACDEHRALAREAAAASLVLLRNEAGALPLAGVRTVALVGELAHRRVTGDRGSSWVRAPHVVTIADGLRERGVRLVDDPSAADAAVVVAGSSHEDEGEWVLRGAGDRGDLRVKQRALIEATAAANRRTIVVLLGGSAFLTDGWGERVAGLVAAWYPGMEGGHAIADALFGDVPFGGRLPCTWPARARDLPPFRRFARRVTYGPLHGHRLLEATGRRAAFPFGFGLGAEQIRRSSTRVDRDTIAMTLFNESDRPAIDVPQVYVREPLGSDPRPLLALRDFRRVRLDPGESATVTLAAPDAALVGRSCEDAQPV